MLVCPNDHTRTHHDSSKKHRPTGKSNGGRNPKRKLPKCFGFCVFLVLAAAVGASWLRAEASRRQSSSSASFRIPWPVSKPRVLRARLVWLAATTHRLLRASSFIRRPGQRSLDGAPRQPAEQRRAYKISLGQTGRRRPHRRGGPKPSAVRPEGKRWMVVGKMARMGRILSGGWAGLQANLYRSRLKSKDRLTKHGPLMHPHPTEARGVPSGKSGKA